MLCGLARRDITPNFPLPMSGYGLRVDHFDDVHDPLQMTVIYVEQDGESAWMISADLCQFPDGVLRERGLALLTRRLGCEPSALFLNASHTHGGPLMNDSFSVPSPGKLVQRSAQNKVLVERYIAWLWDIVASACEEARENAVAARWLYAEGETTFPMNRRALVDGKIHNAPNPDGEFDDRLRLLAVESNGSIQALGLILACHPTSTGAQHRITADYIHGWRQQMRRHVGDETTLFFLQACGGDARPAFSRQGAAWRKVLLDEIPIMGDHLARESCAAIARGWQPLTQPLVRHHKTTVSLPCEEWSLAQYRALLQSDVEGVREYAAYCIRLLEGGGVLQTQVPLDLTLLALDRELVLLGADCELLYGIGRKIEAELPVRHPLALGYTGGCFGYVPDKTELARGGYETESYLWDGWSGPFLPEAEDLILSGVRACFRAASS